MAPLKVLCLDIEGGHGGSSRSLFQAIQRMDRDAVAPTVICRRSSRLEEAYAELGVPCVVEPSMPRWTALARNSRNIVTRALFRTRVWPASKAFRARLLELVDQCDVVHLNHISLTDLAVWLRGARPDTPMVMHLRTMPYISSFASAQARDAARVCDGFVFITENERDHFEAQSETAVPGAVIYNPIEMEDLPSNRESEPEPLRVACLSNYSYYRGLDRLIAIADELPPETRARIRFVMAGDMKLERPLPKDLAGYARGMSTLDELVKSRGLGDCFEFLGHVSDPERVLANSHVLIKPTRENNPWGRDILEAMAAGLPVISVGTYTRFVETGRTGLLMSRFDWRRAAEFLVEMLGDPARRRALGDAAKHRAATLNDPAAQSEKLVGFWRAARDHRIEANSARVRVGAVLPSYAAGGAERVLTTLMTGLSTDRFETRLFVIKTAGGLNADMAGIGFVHNLGLLRTRNALFELWRMFRGFHREVVFSSQAHLNICLLTMARLLPGLRMVVREANMPSDCLAKGHWPRWYRPVYRWALRRAVRVVASSKAMAREFTTVLGVPEDRVAVIHNPVDVESLRANAVPPPERPREGRLFVAVGRLVRQKGFDRVIRWMSELPPEDHLVILGEGEERGALRTEISDRGLSDRVTLHGFSLNPAPIVAGADALVMPSRWEGMPNAALEALALGTPVIATAESGAISEVADMAGDGAVTVADTDADFIAAMRTVSARTGDAPGPSLLPDAFGVATARTRFSDLIDAAMAA